MTTPLTSRDIEAVKRELGQLLPDVKSSHRAEAMARGFGYKTNASLRAQLESGNISRTLDEKAFAAYLTDHEFPKPPYTLMREAVSRACDGETRAAIAAAMAEVPDLTAFGFGIFEDRTKSAAEKQAEFEKKRADMLSAFSIEQFKRAVAFLKTRSKRATISRKQSSYGLKHEVERYFAGQGESDKYVSNGMFIAAAVHLGFKFERSGPNAYFNIGAYRMTDGARPLEDVGPGDRRKAWRNVLVTAINAGLEQKIFGLGEDENSWTGSGGRIFGFEIAGREALAYVSDHISGAELWLKVAVDPTPDARDWIAFDDAGFKAGDAFVTGWFERRRGKWLQQSQYLPRTRFRKHILPVLTNLEIAPKGYSDTGKFMM